MGNIKNPVVKDGALGLILVGKSENLSDQRFLLIRDRNDRGRGDGVLMYGLPGGAAEGDENPKEAFIREIFEETSLIFGWQPLLDFKKFGCYKKKRTNGFSNKNYLFVSQIDLNLVYLSEKNDEDEVSEICILKLSDVVDLAERKQVHEGSIRLIFHYLNESTSGSLNEHISFNGIVF